MRVCTLSSDLRCCNRSLKKTDGVYLCLRDPRFTTDLKELESDVVQWCSMLRICDEQLSFFF